MTFLTITVTQQCIAMKSGMGQHLNYCNCNSLLYCKSKIKACFGVLLERTDGTNFSMKCDFGRWWVGAICSGSDTRLTLFAAVIWTKAYLACHLAWPSVVGSHCSMSFKVLSTTQPITNPPLWTPLQIHPSLCLNRFFSGCSSPSPLGGVLGEGLFLRFTFCL